MTVNTEGTQISRWKTSHQSTTGSLIKSMKINIKLIEQMMTEIKIHAVFLFFAHYVQESRSVILEYNI